MSRPRHMAAPIAPETLAAGRRDGAAVTAASRNGRPSLGRVSRMRRELEAAIGVDAAMRLLAVFGGQRLYFPSRRPSPEMIELIGPTATDALTRAYGGDRIDLPTVPRRELILQLRGLDYSIAEIARTLKLTVRRVYQVLAEL